MPALTVPGSAGSIHVIDLREESPEASGALPIVFVHGMVGHTGFWNTTLAACADRRRVVALDLRGHGNSTAPSDGDYAVDACAGDVLAVLDALALDRIALVGHSFGAFVAIEAAARRASDVRRLVLIDPPGDFTRLPRDVHDAQLVPFLASLDGPDWPSIIETDFEEALDGSSAGAAATVRARLAAMPRDAMRAMYRSMMGYRATEALERYLATPGTSVRSVLAPSNAWPFSLHVLVPAVKATVVPDVGHWIMLDAPDRFITALEDAVDGT